MLTILGDARRFCDGASRRTFLKVGALGALTLPDLLRAEARSPSRGSNKSVILIYLPGGPPHQDMFDLKPDAPSEIRGEFRPIPTNVPGIEICELFPRLARIMDRVVIIRSLVGSDGDHASFQCVTGRSQRRQPAGGWPEGGSVVSKLQGSMHPSVPPYISLSARTQHLPYNYGNPGFLGPAHAPFRAEGDVKESMVLQGVTLERLAERRSLLAGFDRFRRDADGRGLMAGMDAFQEQAFG